MKRFLICLLFASIVSGCTATKMQNFKKKPGQTDEEFFKVKEYCKHIQLQYPGLYPGAEIVSLYAYGSRFNRCMIEKGYETQDEPDYIKQEGTRP